MVQHDLPVRQSVTAGPGHSFFQVEGLQIAAKLTQLGLLAENFSGRLTNCDPALYPVLVVAGSNAAWQEALQKCLGDEALDLHSLAQKKARTLGGSDIPLGLGDFFFNADDPLHPDLEDDEEEDE